jgi:hypothetical protein
MVNTSDITELLDTFTYEIGARRKSVLSQHPLEHYLRVAEEGNRSYHSSYVRLQTLHAAILSEADAKTAALYQKLALLKLLKKRMDDGVFASVFPQRILILYLEEIERIFADLSRLPDAYYEPSHQPFWEDFGLLMGKLIPVGGAWCVETSRLRRKHFFAGGPRQASRFVVFLLLKVRGVSPFYLIHTLKRYTRGFSPVQREECYRGIAALLATNPHVRGLYACGWLYDPLLSQISPELSYLRETPERNGAHVFRIGSSRFAAENATAWSPKRRRLYDEGKYLPADFGLIWPRRELLAWAKGVLPDIL